ncbi:MAG: ATP-binding cassette domain-containing protein [Nitriliruptorales bacterium]|nr:ATP-binding cassette domain-containing protein [Nitriliruptorales bacterium]
MAEQGARSWDGGGGEHAVPDTPVVLQMRDVTKAFGANVANDRIALTLRRGEVHGLLGENGAGKSTLVKILYGLYHADSGEILLDGDPVTIATPRDAVDRGIGMVHQNFMLVPTLTVAENVVLGAEPHRGPRLDRRAAEGAVRDLAQRYGLQVDPTARVGDLSVGVQQRVEILKALYRDARILILDEPTAVLTPQETEDLFAVLDEFVQQGLSIILITHKLGELLRTADRITVIRDGKVVQTLDKVATSEAELARLMVGREVGLGARPAAGPPGHVRLEARGLVVDGPHGAAVHGVDLTVRGGEILAVAGVDGNGQVELAEALAGTRRAREGTVTIDGVDVTGQSAVARRRRGLAYIPEDRSAKGLIAEFTLAENMTVKRYSEEPFSVRGWLRRTVMRRVATRELKAFDVRPPDADAAARSLSGGNQQKAVCARELAEEPGVLVAAQPTRGVDVGAIEFIHRQLLEQRAQGAAILLISLELDEIHALADRIVVICDGRFVGEVNAAEATDEQLGLWMAGRDGLTGVGRS